MKLIDIHTHGGFGINFNAASVEDIHLYAAKIKSRGIVAFCPTLATDSVENLKKQIEIINEAKNKQSKDEAKILGIHLEALFLNPEKCGIHNSDFFLPPTIENFKKLGLGALEGVKIVTLAPELDEGLIEYLNSKNILVHAGHTNAENMYGTKATTHHFNAMPELHHRKDSITLAAINDESAYCEIIGDLTHVCFDMLQLFFRAKNKDKIILISDNLPLAGFEGDSVEFCAKTIYKDGKDEKGSIAGSVMFLDDIAKLLVEKNLLSEKEVQKMVWDNPLKHLGLKML